MMETLVFVGGWGVPKAAFMTLEGALKNIGLSVVIESPDSLIQGSSSGGKFGYARNLLDRYSGDLILAGWSMGGMIAAEAACLEPVRVKGFISVASAPRFLFDEKDGCGTNVGELKALRLAIQRKPKTTLANFYARVFGYDERADLPRDLVAPENLEAWISMVQKENLLNGLDFLGEFNLLGQDQLLRCPVCLFHGTEDRIITAASGQLFSEIALRVDEQIIPCASHALPFTHASVIGIRIAQFLDGISR